MSMKNTNPQANPKTLTEAVKLFADQDVALQFMVNIRWPMGVCCPRCGSTRVRFISTRRVWECREDHKAKRFSVETGTIMEDSPLPLDKWLIAMWLEANAKNSISSYEVKRALGITQKSAWFMQQRVRLAMQQGSMEKMGGEFGPAVEADETFIGGKAHNMHWRRRQQQLVGQGGKGKTAVMGLLERHSDKKCSQVRTQVIENTQKETMQPIIRRHVQPDSWLYTDAHASYAGLGAEFIHKFV